MPRAIASRRRVQTDVTLVRGGDPVTLDPSLAAWRWQPPVGSGSPPSETWSGAGHDAQHLQALIPTLLLFVPLHGGESHTPFEDADPDEIGDSALLACEVLRTLRLDSDSRV